MYVKSILTSRFDSKRI